MNYEEITAKNVSSRKNLLDAAKKEPQQSKAKLHEFIEISSRASVFETIAITVAIVGVIAGIICGFVFPSTEIVQKSIYLSPKTEEVFNAGIMFAVWLGTAFSTIAYWAIYCILDSMDNMLIELKRANRYHKQNANEE